MPSENQIDLAALSRESHLSDLATGNSLLWFGIADSTKDAKALLASVENWITEGLANEIARLGAIAADYDELKKDDFWQDSYPLEWEHIIAPQFRSAFFLYLMATAEHQLTTLIRHADTAIAGVMSFSAPRKFYISAETHLRDVCGVVLPSKGIWATMQLLQQVRNVLAHRGGYLEPQGDQNIVTKAAKAFPGFRTDLGSIELQASFCTFAMTHVEAFLLESYHALAERCRTVAASSSKETYAGFDRAESTGRVRAQ